MPRSLLLHGVLSGEGTTDNQIGKQRHGGERVSGLEDRVEGWGDGEVAAESGKDRTSVPGFGLLLIFS